MVSKVIYINKIRVQITGEKEEVEDLVEKIKQMNIARNLMKTSMGYPKTLNEN